MINKIRRKTPLQTAILLGGSIIIHILNLYCKFVNTFYTGRLSLRIICCCQPFLWLCIYWTWTWIVQTIKCSLSLLHTKITVKLCPCLVNVPNHQSSFCWHITSKGLKYNNKANRLNCFMKFTKHVHKTYQVLIEYTLLM